MSVSIKELVFRQYPWYLNLQALNLILPLIAYPYLLRCIGPERYGLIAVAGAFGLILTTVSDYGTGMTGVRETAIRRGDPNGLSVFLGSKMLLRGSIYLLSLLISIPLFLFVPFFREEMPLVLLSAAVVVPMHLYPQWLFVGLERVREYSFMIFLNKAVSLVLVFVFVQNADDYVLFPLTVLLPSLMTAVTALFYLRTIGIRLALPRSFDIQRELSEGFPMSVSQLVTTFYSQWNSMVLFWLLPQPALVGYFAFAERIITIVRGLLAPFNQLFLPSSAGTFAESFRTGYAHVLRISRFSFAVNLLGTIVLVLAAPLIVPLIGGEAFIPAVTTLRYYAPVLILAGFNNLAGVHILLNTGMHKEFMAGVFAGLFVNLAAMALLVPVTGFHAPAISSVMAESAVLMFFLWTVRRKAVSWTA
ncbi:MAG: oligosaccharide flippase family protein [Bacteroidetes bacterium]|nr:oligosaccharide flippase family protein [Bacteroidota bacterium]